jgi:hypothetical protein
MIRTGSAFAFMQEIQSGGCRLPHSAESIESLKLGPPRLDYHHADLKEEIAQTERGARVSVDARPLYSKNP